MKFIDTHCHLEMRQYDKDRDAVIKRAEDSGLEALITISSDIESNTVALGLAEKYPIVYASVGIHPHDAKDFSDDICNKFRQWSEKKKVVAIGETGLDYHYDNSPRAVQRDVFRKHLALAKEVDLPAIMHSREAKDDTIAIMRESDITRGVLHCFSGDQEMAEKAMMMGIHISFAGPVTFNNARKAREIAQIIPDDYLLIETDAPYLTPSPHRGKRNEPSYIIHTARAIADARGVTVEDIARITTLNAKRLFKIGQVAEKGEIAYKIRNSLYLNITNRCTNRCSFCVRSRKDFVKGHNLKLAVEPSSDELIAAIGDPKQYKEIVFCGYGEPLLRLDVVKHVASWIKKGGGQVRINTNGHGNLIHKRNILPELHNLVDSLSISIDAPDREAYERVCVPMFSNAFDGILDFIRESKKYVPSIQLTVVDTGDIDTGKCKNVAEDLGVGFRIRNLDRVG
jgi:TatD DNase family protein